jgi:hypothetical protein
MPQTKRKRPSPGDVIEIPIPNGFSYAQYIHLHAVPPKYGALLRVLPGTFDHQLSDFKKLVLLRESFLAFFPLGAACRRGIVRVVSKEPIPYWSQKFPTFRTGIANKDGKVRKWFIWDGKTERAAGTLTDREKGYPYLTGVWNDTLLIERISSRWLPPLYEDQCENSP